MVTLMSTQHNVCFKQFFEKYLNKIEDAIWKLKQASKLGKNKPTDEV